MSTQNSVSCLLCVNKTLKNLRGLHIHQRVVHQATTTNSFSCPLCPHSSFKSKSGWSRHENLKHDSYNIPKHFNELPQDHINETKAALVYLIRSRLKLHSKHSGLQTISSPLTESEFVCIFQDHIKRYSFCRQRYICYFGGYDAYDTLSHIFNETNWGRRIFEHGQWSEVMLVPDSASPVMCTKSLRNSLRVNPKNPEMIIMWEKKEIYDNEENVSTAGWVMMRFLVGQFY
ncbi:hypothetical protein C2G38_2152857 [Gigaspora rosea]|uniref:C2H2-type domain-containing protein n=1 Tax=Gigaspora rosea TaxID=44941 RepID=A0A397WA31_9GLOM|nr:hypothetical protein C2G38_2152857 [Gigaspora rosea]